jgi:glutathione S-transferase
MDAHSDAHLDLYFSPMACPLASRIALYEAQANDVRFIEVDPTTKRTLDGTNTDYRTIYPLGLVPLLRLEDGQLLSENAAVLQYIANRYPQAQLAPADVAGRARLQQWLGFISTELHKGFFSPLFDQKAPTGTREYILKKFEPRLRYLNGYLTGREYLLDRFSVADAYLYTVLNWAVPTRVDLADWPAIKSYHESLQSRPSIAKAFLEEMTLYKAELARHKAAACAGRSRKRAHAMAGPRPAILFGPLHLALLDPRLRENPHGGDRQHREDHNEGREVASDRRSAPIGEDRRNDQHDD